MAADKLTQLQESLEESSGAPLRRQTTKSFHPSFAGEVEKDGYVHYQYSLFFICSHRISTRIQPVTDAANSCPVKEKAAGDDTEPFPLTRQSTKTFHPSYADENHSKITCRQY